jgi:hypothetical protein
MNRRSFLQMLGIGVVATPKVCATIIKSNHVMDVVPVAPIVPVATPNAFSGMIVMTASSWCTMSTWAGSPQSYVSSGLGLQPLSTQQIVFSNRT